MTEKAKVVLGLVAALSLAAFAIPTPASADGPGEWWLWNQTGPDEGYCETEIECQPTPMGLACCRIIPN